ncbi:annexin Gh1-like [Rosa sericea]
MPTLDFEIECKEIHDSWIRPPEQLNQLVRSLARRNRHERQQIRETYKAIYGEDLVSRLQHKADGDDADQITTGISPNLCAAVSLWMINQHEGDAIFIQEALHNDQQGRHDKNYNALVEIFASRKSSQILLIKQAYHTKFRRQLDQDIINIELAHPHQKIVVALVASHKAHHADVNQDIAKSDARRLFETGRERSSSGIQEAVVLELFSKRSIPQLKLTFSCYKHIYGHDYKKSLKSVSSGEFENALKMVVQCIHNPPNYFAKILHASIKGLTSSSTSDDKGALVRVMVSRAEVDMDEIQRMFKKKHGVELRDAIISSVTGDNYYTDFLVALASKSK